jgi:phosphatidylinositol alpha-1,6-mannosyltransferase
MKSLALLSLDFPPLGGGVSSYLLETSRRLDGEFAVTVLTPVSGGPIEDGIIARRVVADGGVLGFLAALRSLRPDRVLVGHAHPRLLAAAGLFGRPYALIAHGNDFLAAQGRWHRPLFNRLVRNAEPLIANSRATADRLRSLGRDVATVVPPGADPERFTPRASPSGAVPTLLTVSRLVPRKGIDTVLRALPALRSRWPDLRYRIAGDGPDRERLEALAEKLALGGAVDFVGHVADPLLPALYRDATLFVMPVREEQAEASVEGFGIVYLEAAACGLPVIAGDSGGAAEAIVDGQTGLLVPPDDPARLAETALRLLDDEPLRQRMGAAGREWVEREMNWDRAARELGEALA